MSFSVYTTFDHEEIYFNAPDDVVSHINNWLAETHPALMVEPAQLIPQDHRPEHGDRFILVPTTADGQLEGEITAKLRMVGATLTGSVVVTHGPIVPLCQVCRSELPNTAKYCPKCGTIASQ